MSISLSEAAKLKSPTSLEGGQVPLEDSLRQVQNWIKHKPDPDFPNCFLIPISTLEDLLKPDEADLVVAFLGIKVKTFKDGSSMLQLHILLASAQQIGEKEGNFKLLGRTLQVSNPSYDPIEKKDLSPRQRKYIQASAFLEPISRKKTRKWAMNWRRYLEQKMLDFPQFIVFTKREIADVASIAHSDVVRLTLVYKELSEKQVTDPQFMLDFVYFGASTTPFYDLSAVNVMRPGEEGGVDIGCICPGLPCCCLICNADDYLKPIKSKSNTSNPRNVTALVEDSIPKDLEKKMSDTRVPLAQALEWSKNWIDNKPHINIPNSVMIRRDVAVRFLDNEEMDLVVVFLGLEKVASDSGDEYDHVRVFACGAKSVPDKPGGFALIKGEEALTLGYCSFDPMSKNDPRYKHITYLAHAKEGNTIDVKTAMGWAKNWAEYIQEHQLDYPEYTVYSEEEVKDMTSVPGTDTLRLLFVYKPDKDGGAANPYKLDFIFFGAKMLHAQDYTAANVMRPDEYYGQDHGCNCPGQPCCSCSNHRCTGYDFLKEVL